MESLRPVPNASTTSSARRALLEALTQVVGDQATAQRLLDRTLQHSGHPAVPRSRHALLDFVRDHVVAPVGATVGPVRCALFVRTLVGMVKQLPPTRRSPRSMRATARAAAALRHRVLIRHGDRLAAAAIARALVRARLEPLVVEEATDAGGVGMAIVDLDLPDAEACLAAVLQRNPSVVVVALVSNVDESARTRLQAVGARRFDVLPIGVAAQAIQLLAHQRLAERA